MPRFLVLSDNTISMKQYMVSDVGSLISSFLSFDFRIQIYRRHLKCYHQLLSLPKVEMNYRNLAVNWKIFKCKLVLSCNSKFSISQSNSAQKVWLQILWLNSWFNRIWREFKYVYIQVVTLWRWLETNLLHFLSLVKLDSFISNKYTKKKNTAFSKSYVNKC